MSGDRQIERLKSVSPGTEVAEDKNRYQHLNCNFHKHFYGSKPWVSDSGCESSPLIGEEIIDSHKFPGKDGELTLLLCGSDAPSGRGYHPLKRSLERTEPP
jgi:hypothetical protein